MIGLDTTSLIDLFKQDSNLINTLIDLEEEIFISDLVYLELMKGLDPTNKKHAFEELFYDNYFKSSKTVALNKLACKKARNIIWNLKKKGKTVHLIDATIAATYLINNINTIITKNKKDFEQIEELKVISY
jgi:predicted nucleic acid-binding protein